VVNCFVDTRESEWLSKIGIGGPNGAEWPSRALRKEKKTMEIATGAGDVDAAARHGPREQSRLGQKGPAQLLPQRLDWWLAAGRLAPEKAVAHVRGERALPSPDHGPRVRRAARRRGSQGATALRGSRHLSTCTAPHTEHCSPRDLLFPCLQPRAGTARMDASVSHGERGVRTARR